MDINLTSPKTVRTLLDENGIAPLKKYGQNFLIDGNIADKIAAAALPEGGNALEVGPGLGALTQRLAAHARAVAAYEIDAGLFRVLGRTFADAENVTLFHADFLKAELEMQLAPVFADGAIYAAANLPYYITSPCIMKLLTSDLDIRRITVMVQKEVAERICAGPGGRDYGSISAAVQYFGEPKLLFHVSPACFFPKPDVHSAVLSIDIRDTNPENTDIYLKTVKGLFAKRRKTVRSNLRESFGLTLEEAQKVMERAGIDENARAETLSVNDFLRIGEQITKNS